MQPPRPYSNAPAACLLIEDNNFDQRLIMRVLKKSGMELPVLVAPTLDEARIVLAEQKIRFILLDNSLPDGYGADFALELSANPATAVLPVMMLTDWPSPFMTDKAKMAGVLAILGKAQFGPQHVQIMLAARQSARRPVGRAAGF